VGDRRRSILHVDLDPFFVSVERSLDPLLRGRPVIVGGGDAPSARVAAASPEARTAGVRPGQSLAEASRLCPQGVFRRGDLDTYGRFSEDVTSILLAASRRVQRPSADEAYADLTPEHPAAPSPVSAAETIREEIQRRLGLDASLGLASSRLAARVASAWARPRGFLLVLPGYEASFLAGQPMSFLSDLPPHLEAALHRAGLGTLGQVAEATESTLAGVVGAAAAPRLRQAARGEAEEPIPVSAPPAWIQEQAAIRDRRSDRAALESVLEGLASRVCRRLRPHGLRARLLTVEVQRSARDALRRSESFHPGVSDEDTIRSQVRALAGPLLDPAASVRTIQVRLGRLEPPGAQSHLFPDAIGAARG
jgi:DNA polymerase-4